LALALLILAAQPAAAYTFLFNAYPNSPVGCNNVYPYLCIRWPFAANGYSSTVYVYLDASLSVVHPGDTGSLPQEALAAMSRWNAVPARSPFLVQVSSDRASSGFSYGMATEVARTDYVPWPAYAATSPRTKYMLTGSGDQHKIVAFFLDMSDQYVFGPHSSYNVIQIDGDYILTHEFGHGLGLGHTGMVSMMYPYWTNSVYMGIVPTTNAGGDVPGLQALYSPTFCDSCIPPG
jgi:hypothetical protein